ncbi:unnamed protein product, partial [Tilletia controversa]
WPDMRTATDVLNFLDASVPVTAATFYVLQGVITPDGDMIGNGLIPFTDNPSNLLELAKTINAGLIHRIKGWKQKGVNIVIADYVNWSPKYVDTIVKLNE